MQECGVHRLIDGALQGVAPRLPADFRRGVDRGIFVAGMQVPKSIRRRTGAERVSVSAADASGGLALPLASRRPLIPGLGVFIAFLVVASMAWERIADWRSPPFDTWFHRGIIILKGLWVVALFAAAVLVLALAIVLLFYRESARLAGERLIHVVRLGPVHVIMEYDLAKVQNLRAVNAGKAHARVRFEYGGADHTLGRDVPSADAAVRVKAIQTAIDRLGARRPSQAGGAVPPPTPGPQR